MEKIDRYKPEYYENRELSWLKFNERVLAEAMDETVPLIERLRFASIFSTSEGMITEVRDFASLKAECAIWSTVLGTVNSVAVFPAAYL